MGWEDDISMNCVHHWDIESPNGLYSRGICRYCGEERMFSNWRDWDEGYKVQKHRAAVWSAGSRDFEETP